MPDAGPGRSNCLANAEGPTDPVGELWAVNVGTPLTAPIVANETVYVVDDDGIVLALDARTGEERWRKPVGSPTDTPSVRNDILYVPVADRILALDASDGTRSWEIETGPRKGTLVASHGLYSIGDRDAPVVERFSLEDGSQQWQMEIDRCGAWNGYAFAGPDVLVVSSSTSSPKPWVLNPETGAFLVTPDWCGHDAKVERFYRNGMRVGIGEFGGVVSATPVSADETRWQRSVSIAISNVSGDSKRVYVTRSERSDAGLDGLSLSDGTTEWSIEREWTTVTRPVVTAQCLLCKSDLGLHCFSPTDGTERWTRTVDDVGDEFVVADDLVYTTTDGTVRAFR